MQVLLQYQSKSYYIIGQEVYYSIGRFYYIIGQLLQYRAFITLSVGTTVRLLLQSNKHTKFIMRRQIALLDWARFPIMCLEKVQ